MEKKIKKESRATLSVVEVNASDLITRQNITIGRMGINIAEQGLMIAKLTGQVMKYQFQILGFDSKDLTTTNLKGIDVVIINPLFSN